MNSFYFSCVPHKIVTGLLLTSAIALTGCGGGGGGGSSSSSSSSSVVSSAVLANVNAQSKLLTDNPTVGGLAFAGESGTAKSLSVVYNGASSNQATIDGTDYTLSNVTEVTSSNTYSAMLSFEADNQQYNNVVVGSPTETANITNAASKNLTQTEMTGTTEIDAQVAQTTGDASQTSVLSLSGTSNVTIDFSTGKVTMALSDFSGQCTGTCGATDGSTSTSPVVASPLSLSITNASITNSGFSGGTLSVSDTGNADGLNVDFGALGFDDSTVTHGGQFFGEGSVVDGVTLPKEAGGNFYAATSEGDWIQGGYLASE